MQARYQAPQQFCLKQSPGSVQTVFRWLFTVLALTPALLLAVPYQQDAATGLVVFEAERADTSSARNGYSWVANLTAGYSADSGLRTSPTSGPAVKTGYSLTSPQLDYQVNFVQTGTHYVWVRGIGNQSSNNSVHVGLDGIEVATSAALNFPLTTNWVWHGGVGVAQFEVTSLGVHTVNVWMRETGFRIDKLIVTTDAGFTPTGTGPVESTRGSGGGGANQVPVAVVGGPYSGLEGATISFDGSASFDLDADPLTYSWDFGDATALGSGVAPNHSYATAGSYTVTLTVNDGSLNSAASSTTASVTVVSGGGTPAFQQDATTGLVVFEAERADTNAARSGYSWVANLTAGYSADSGLRTSPTSGKAIKTGYSQTSPQLDYQVNFVQTGTHYVWVRGIGDQSSNNSVHVGLDGIEVATSAALNFPLTTNWVWNGGVGVAQFEVASPGVHTVNVWMRETGFRIDKLIVTTDAGFTPTGAGPVESPRSSGGGGTNQVPVAVIGGPYSGLEGATISFDGSASFDPDADPLTYSWNFGDGTAPGSGVAPGHSYATAGSYTVVLTVNDGSQNSAPSSTTVTVTANGGVNQAPVANAGGSYSSLTGTSVSFDGSASSDADGDSLTYSWNFGDGSASGSGVAPSHIYVAAGSYTVTLTVNDGTVNSTVPSTTSVSVVDGGGTLAFQQDAATGRIVFEAERADTNSARSGYSWVANLTGGYSADSGLRTSPTSGPAVKTGYSQTSPQLDYRVNFVQTGTHYVWVRGIGNQSSNNSVHVGLDGIEVATSAALNFPLTTSWVWHGGVGVAQFEVASPGVHTVNVWMRETGFRIDKLIVTTDAGFIPAGTGPVESPRSTGGGNAALLADDFNDGNTAGWSVFSECIKGAANWSVVNSVLVQSGECRGYSPEGVAIASHLLSAVSLPANVDIQVQVSSLDPATDGVATNDSSIWKNDTLGVLFAYQDQNNHYRFEMNGMKGHRKLWRKQGGVFTELNTSPQSFVPGQVHNVRIVHQNNIIVVYIDGQHVMSAEDATFSSGQVALFCARNSSCNFDNLVVANAPVAPAIGLQLSASGGHAYSEYFVDTDNVLDVTALTTISSGIGGIEFVIDEGGAGEQSFTDLVSPYTAQFSAVTTGNHTVKGYLLDGSATRLLSADASATLQQVSTGGIHLYAFGDSITNGIGDDLTTDDASLDGRNTGGGYEPLLNDFLAQDNGVPVTVINDGNPGEESNEGAERVSSIVSRTPEVQAFLVFYGANDSGGSTPKAPGLGLNVGDAGYAGSFKDYMQQIIDAIQAQNKTVVLATAPMYLAKVTRNDLVVQYNQVVEQLILENALGYVAPDLYGYFFANQNEYTADGIHPNGLGYQSMSSVWCGGINGVLGLTCIP